MNEASHRYVIALGSNMRVPGIGGPREVIDAAITELPEHDISILAAAPTIDSAPVGPSIRRYANSAAVIAAEMPPPELLQAMQMIEHKFGRIRQGQPWRSRTLDLDIVLWDRGVWASDSLTIPHPRFRERSFVLGPAASIAPGCRDPITGLSLRQLFVRLTQPRPIPR